MRSVMTNGRCRQESRRTETFADTLGPFPPRKPLLVPFRLPVNTDESLEVPKDTASGGVRTFNAAYTAHGVNKGDELPRVLLHREDEAAITIGVSWRLVLALCAGYWGLQVSEEDILALIAKEHLVVRPRGPEGSNGGA